MDVIAFGEVLWDIFPDKKVIGGAPFNFCAHFARLGGKAGLVTAVGRDPLGNETLDRIREMGISDEFVSESSYPTGVCLVTVDSKGTPAYELRQDMAYDHILPTDGQWAAIRSASAPVLYFGTLAQRNAVSRKTLAEILSCRRFDHLFFDVNIRQSWFDREIVERGLRVSTILKVSREEDWIFGNLGLTSVKEGDFRDQKDYYLALCRAISRDYGISTILLTLDKDGGMVYDGVRDRAHFYRKPTVKAVSTVGAGDSFSACYLYHLLKGLPAEECLDKAVLLSDYVVGHIEAVPEYSDKLKATLFD
ncbi:MAG: hypothetical protein GX303_03160 [Clostridiales bacterium]|nr:hypothetical protein [Clostridiales bacterium]